MKLFKHGEQKIRAVPWLEASNKGEHEFVASMEISGWADAAGLSCEPRRIYRIWEDADLFRSDTRFY